jgi:hypothetical protein
MSLLNQIIKLRDGSNWDTTYGKNATKIFIHGNGGKTRIGVKESKAGNYVTDYNNNMQQMEIEKC